MVGIILSTLYYMINYQGVGFKINQKIYIINKNNLKYEIIIKTHIGICKKATVIM